MEIIFSLEAELIAAAIFTAIAIYMTFNEGKVADRIINILKRI